MIESLEIRNFKCFLQETINFNQLTINAGGNATGKSSVLQALLLIDKARDSKQKLLINNKSSSFLEFGDVNQLINSNSEEDNISFIIKTSKINDIQKITLIPTGSTLLSFEVVKEPIKNDYLNPWTSLHYLNAERIGPRNVQVMQEQDELRVGYQGELTGQAIVNARLQKFKIPIEKRLSGNQSDYHDIDMNTQSWLDFIFPGIELRVDEFPKNINQVFIGLKKAGAGTDFLHPNNIGFGISYVLPIIVSGLIATEGSILIVENPEAHLHPAGQSKIGFFLAQIANSGIQVVLETHSEHVINGIRLAILREKISFDKVLINFFTSSETNSSKKQEIKLNRFAELTSWPVGFFDQEEIDLSNIFKARKSIADEG